MMELINESLQVGVIGGGERKQVYIEREGKVRIVFSRDHVIKLMSLLGLALIHTNPIRIYTGEEVLPSTAEPFVVPEVEVKWGGDEHAG